MPELDAEHRDQMAEALLTLARRDNGWDDPIALDDSADPDYYRGLADALAPLVAGWLADARASAIRNPYDEDGYCEFCGNHCGKPHSPTCGWADLRDARADALREAADDSTMPIHAPYLIRDWLTYRADAIRGGDDG